MPSSSWSSCNCETIMATAVSFCCPRDSVSRATRWLRRSVTSARWGPAVVMPRSRSRSACDRSASLSVVPAAHPVVNPACTSRPPKRSKVACSLRSQALEDPLARLGDRLALRDQLFVPAFDGDRPAPERGVPLLQRPVVPRPVESKGWFHVEHQPVQPASAPLGALVDELVDLRIDGLHGDDAGQLEQRPCILAIDPGARAAVRGDFDSGLLGRRIVRTAVYGQLGLAMADEPFAVARAEGPSAAQQENGFEDGGLAGAVFPGDQVELGQRTRALRIRCSAGFRSRSSARDIANERRRCGRID